MCTENDLMESGHGFMIFNESQCEYGDLHPTVAAQPFPISEDWDSSFKKAVWGYIKSVYLVEGGEAARILKENENNVDFWDNVRTFHYYFF